jgi:hypothetical protein
MTSLPYVSTSPTDNVCDGSRTKAFDEASRVGVKTGVGARRVDVVPSITMYVAVAEAVRLGRKYVLPEMVIAGPPGNSVWVPMTKAEALFAVMGSEPSVRTSGSFAEGWGLGAWKVDVVPSMTM